MRHQSGDDSVNCGITNKAAVEFAITTHGLRDIKEFWPQLRLAIKRGLSQEAALAELCKKDDWKGRP